LSVLRGCWLGVIRVNVAVVLQPASNNTGRSGRNFFIIIFLGCQKMPDCKVDFDA
jgi:hypothetical protein